ncbi:MAG: pyrimidine-nucleoside phosphorylase [Bacilli bacterium]|nr:pyrimidine-nucleoside phosphorylase [Bacilli bacterium]MDY6430202.1 pyrimidine-nucleoside phosphorylase [Bacilli bacterium]
MRIVDVIEKKRDGHALNEEEIDFFVQGYAKGEIPDYQISALAMAIFFRGMNEQETIYLTNSMLHSGEVIDLESIEGFKVDKHSTGGVGDKTSLVLAPLVAACGGKVAKMSGRGLGHTGGTLDKMESVPGMRIALSKEEFVSQVNKIGIAIIGQTADIDPADKKLYALRDVTGTVNSIPLIASSIMSKKLASGSNGILLDVKFGSGAFMKDIESAKTLANLMVKIGKGLGRDTRAILTDMDQPLGFAVGNNLEVIEAVNTLKGRGPKDLTELVIKAGAIMLEQSKLVSSLEEGELKIENAIRDGSGFDKLVQMFDAQGGDTSYLKNIEKFPKAKNIVEICAENEGYIKRINSLSIGISAMKLGAGRKEIKDNIDMTAGIVLNKKVADLVKKGDVLATLYTNIDDIEEIKKEVHDAFEISKEPVDHQKIIHYYIH